MWNEDNCWLVSTALLSVVMRDTQTRELNLETSDDVRAFFGKKKSTDNVLIAQYFASRKPLCRDQSFPDTGFRHFGTIHESPGQNGLVRTSPLSNMPCTGVRKRRIVKKD